MNLQEIVIGDLILNQIYETIKFATLQHAPARVRKIADDGITSTIEILNPDGTTYQTQQHDTAKHIWQVNL